MARAVSLSLLLALTACASPDGSSPAPLIDAPRLVEVGPAGSGPPGGDAVPSVAVAFHMPDGSLRSVDREAIAFVPRFGDGAALVDPERRLYEVTPDGMRRMLTADATGSLTVSPDGAVLAYVVAREALGALRTHDGERERTLADGLASIGVLRFVDDRILFVGGRPGGVAGVWLAAPDAAPRCLTNCTLQTGTAWRDVHVPPPVDPSSFALVDGVVSWTDPSGARRSVRLAEAAR